MVTCEIIVQLSSSKIHTELSFPQKVELTFLALLILTVLMLLIEAARLT